MYAGENVDKKKTHPPHHISNTSIIHTHYLQTARKSFCFAKAAAAAQ